MERRIGNSTREFKKATLGNVAKDAEGWYPFNLITPTAIPALISVREEWTSNGSPNNRN
jgi:hypothetical protein